MTTVYVPSSWDVGIDGRCSGRKIDIDRMAAWRGSSLAAADTISASLSAFEALSLDWSDGFDEAQRKVCRRPRAARPGTGGAHPDRHVRRHPLQRRSMTFYQPAKVEVLTGVNLPMVLRLACQAGARRAPSPSSPAGCRPRPSGASAWRAIMGGRRSLRSGRGPTRRRRRA